MRFEDHAINIAPLQWDDRERGWVWEFAVAHVEEVTFAGVSMQIPLESAMHGMR